MTSAAPARGTRPRNRRALIIAAAADLFHRVGYAAVSMSDIAQAVNVSPSALYRHFPGKGELLAAAARAAIAPTVEHLAAAGDTPKAQLMRELAGITLAHRQAGVLWHREARLLPAEVRIQVRDDLRTVAGLLAGRIGRDRAELNADQAELLAWSALAAMSSVSFHQLHLPQATFEDVLSGILIRITDAPLPDDLDRGDDTAPAAGLAPRTRREQLLRAAGVLFADRGYAAVTIDDIGAAVGIAGPSVYNHFASKQEILLAALDRGNEWLWMELDGALTAATDEADALARLLTSYVHLATHRSDLVDVVVGDLRQLPAADLARARQSQLDYITEWTELLRTVRPDLDPTAARIVVQAALMLVNDSSHTRRLARRPGYAEAVRAIAGHLLG